MDDGKWFEFLGQSRESDSSFKDFADKSYLGALDFDAAPMSVLK